MISDLHMKPRKTPQMINGHILTFIYKIESVRCWISSHLLLCLIFLLYPSYVEVKVLILVQ